ncbi:hypothetical protein BA720P3_00016 [Bifidobacterium phage BA720P3]|nr:hypothetical protein BA720P3_00016 [Bifidobacterium phage BA720P3]WAX05537.1 hypothetical protein BA746P1_00016 [Bifidobacterium phage BA746P1]
MWILGDWGQSRPWQRTSGVKMTKSEGGVYTGVLTLPKGTTFRLKVMKSTVEDTSGGVNVWSATSYSSVLNSHGAYDFGEFTNNLVPNGSFEEGAVKWTPSSCIIKGDTAINGDYSLYVGDQHPNSATSDTFVIPPNQDLRLSGYMYSWNLDGSGVVEIKDADTQSVLFKTILSVKKTHTWEVFSGTFKTGGSPVAAQIVCTHVGTHSHSFDNMSLVTP